MKSTMPENLKHWQDRSRVYCIRKTGQKGAKNSKTHDQAGARSQDLLGIEINISVNETFRELVAEDDGWIGLGSL